jgi:sugar/nucleoside kinase (ribokinase family)
MQRLLTDFDTAPEMAPGGSAGNTIFGLARLGLSTALIGKIGHDSIGQYYYHAAAATGLDVTRLKRHETIPSGHCLSLITPDSERTLRTYLGASAALEVADITPEDFRGAKLVHLEGYLLFNRDLALHVLDCAKTAGCTVSLDLASFEVVHANQDILDELLNRYVDIVFANEDEAEAWAASSDPREALELLSTHCHISAVKLGAEGAMIKRGNEFIQVPVVPVRAVDTTGAGDLWAAGFLYGLVGGHDFATCGHDGAVLGAEVVQLIGAAIPEARWPDIKEIVR